MRSAWQFSFHLMSGLSLVQGILFAAAALFALMLLAGYRTRWATFLSWIFLISLHSRNQAVLQSSDTLLRMMLFWSIFAPLGARWSMDCRRKPDLAQSPASHLSAGSLALYAQVVMIYGFTVLNKWGPVWGAESSAVYYAMSLEHFTRPLGLWLLQFPELMAFLTRIVFAFEIAGPALLFFPVWTVSFRLYAIAGFILMHLSFWMFIQVGQYPPLAIMAMLPFLPGALWDDRRVTRIVTHIESRISGALKHAEALHSRVEKPLASALRFVFLTVLPIFFAGYVFLWNVAQLPAASIRFTRDWTRVAQLLRLDQKWNMFAPPSTIDGWFVIEGRLEDGRRIDLYRDGEAVSWAKPPVVSQTHKNQRWRKFMINLRRDANHAYRPLYARYLCREWNASHSGSQKLKSLEILFMRERTLPDFRTEKVKKISLIQQSCP